jgi:peptidyl-prolyl cis-trans isomerase A (cyclophilin A)
MMKPMRKTKSTLPALFVLGLALLGPAVACAAEDPVAGQFSIDDALKGLPGSGKLTAAIVTSMGTLNCELYADTAPITVANFVGLARGTRPFFEPKTQNWVKRNFYDGLIFHRVIPGFMIQGGDIQGNGTGEPGYTIRDEKNEPHSFDKGGVLAMANRGANTAGSQFFITENATPALDDNGRSRGHYQIFGQCAEVELVKKIASQPRDGRDKPFQDVKIEKVVISRGAGAGKAATQGKPGAAPAKPAAGATKPAAAKPAAGKAP